MRAVFTFCFVLERCKTKQVRLERFCRCLVLHKSLLATEGSTINKIPSIPQCTLPPRPVHQTLLSIFRGSGSETILFQPRPLPDCISQPWRKIDFISKPWRKIDFSPRLRDKIWEWTRLLLFLVVPSSLALASFPGSRAYKSLERG